MSGDYRLTRIKGRANWHVVVYENGRRLRFSLGTEERLEAERRLALWRSTRAGGSGQSGGWDGSIRGLWQAYRHENAHKRVSEQMEWTGRALSRFMDLPVSSITVDKCRDHINRRRTAGIGDGTIWTELGHLRTVLRWAEQRGIIERAPYVERPRKPAPRDVSITQEQMADLLAAADQPHIHVYLSVALGTGARSAAILALTWNRVDFETGMIDLRDPTATQAQKRRAVVPMNDRLYETLKTAKKGAVSDYVVEYGGKALKSVKRGFRRSCERAGLGREVTPHVLRHSVARLMAESGVPMAEISQFLGHSSLKQTESTYARYSPGYLRRAADVLNIGGTDGQVHPTSDEPET